MSTSTTNMGLVKPATTETADITVINSNMDKLDAHRHGGSTDGLPIRAVQSGTLSARPSAGSAGALYVSTDTNDLFLDNGTAWQPAAKDFTPPGAMTQYAGAAAPAGWLLCNGQEVSRATYSALFAAIGTTFGVGDGSTTFNVPDLRGRVVLGADNMGGVSANRVTATQADNLGQGAGEENHTLITGEMPIHNHAAWYSASRASASTLGYFSGQTANGSNTMSSTGTYQSSTPIDNAGGDGAHNNMPPYLTLNYIIKA